MTVNYGVVVGRFQVNNLHQGHLALFQAVAAKHDRVIVFIGVSRTVPTKRNPLDFEVRKKMIQADYPDFTILPLRDEPDDEMWSASLDKKIDDVTMFTGDVTLYGGRDSFAPHYYGKHKVNQLDIPSPVTGTEIRDRLSNRVMQSPDFRAGVIYAISNQFPRMLATVDAAIFHNDGQKNWLLMGKKPGETQWRFVGGFVNKGETLEQAVRRESNEETNLDITSVEYIDSIAVSDWRYQNDSDAGITTSLFAAWSMNMTAKAGDDLEKVQWFSISDLPLIDQIVGTHVPLFEKVQSFIGRKKYGSIQPTS